MEGLSSSKPNPPFNFISRKNHRFRSWRVFFFSPSQMFSLQICTNLNLLSSSSSSTQSISSSRNTAFCLTNPCCSLRNQVEIPLGTRELQSRTKESETTWRNKEDDEQTRNKDSMERGKGDRDAKEISGIRVPRQRYISVSKADLLSATLSMFETQEEAEEFRRVSTCLDSILHAEHKGILEEMRIDYSLTQSLDSKRRGGDVENLETLKEETLVNGKHKLEESADAFKSNQANAEEEKVNDFGLMSFSQGLDWSFLLGLSGKKDLSKSASLESRIAVATRFQRSFMKLLRNAQFEELSARDLLLTSALNTDYLLTLPIYVDWKRASESNAIIFRRGYATETQRGFLFVEKLDYLQSRLLQGVFFSLSKPLGKIGMWMKEALESASQNQEFEVWIKRTKLWLKEPFSQPLYSNNESIFDSQTATDQLSDSDLPIWLAAQRAVPRYEGLLSSIGPRGRLLRRLLIWTGLVPYTPETSPELDCENTSSELYLRPTFLSRVSLGDIWRPATKERCGNDLLKMFQTAISILFSQSILQEPAFQELILLYTEEMVHGENEDKAEVPPLKLKIYEKIPIPDLPVVFPHKKLSFRIIDTVRLDAASILGLLAFFVNYKFEDIRSSPSAILLDVIAISALIIYVTRIALGYKQTWDRYQLLVNRTLYEKTLASGFGSVHFLLDASEQQQFKEAILAYAILLQAADQRTSHKSIGDSCEKFMYNKFQKKVEMPVDKALNTLLRFGLVREVSHDGNIRFQALSCSEAYKFLKQHWECLLT